MKTYKVGSLFAGVGGIDLGFLNASTKEKMYKIAFANEIDAYASITYRHNFKHNLLEGDIRKIISANEKSNNVESLLKKKMVAEPIDVLTAGFPCQAFSIAGYRKGFEDDRGNLFWSIVDTIKLFEKHQGAKPRVLFLENVKNLKNHDNGRTFKIIKESLENLGYLIKEKVINTMKVSSLPQNRERIFIIGFLNKQDFSNFDYFEKIDSMNQPRSSAEKLNSIKKIIQIDKRQEQDYYYTKEKYPKYFIKGAIDLTEDIKEEYKFYQVRRGMYIRENKNNVCPTLTANMGTGGHNVPLVKDNYGIRKLTPEETFRLQGFPIGEGYELPKLVEGKKISKSHFYKQAGNAVSVEVIQQIALSILQSLD